MQFEMFSLDIVIHISCLRKVLNGSFETDRGLVW